MVNSLKVQRQAGNFDNSYSDYYIRSSLVDNSIINILYFTFTGSSFSRRLRGKSMYHMTRGYDESSRLMGEPVPSSSAPNLTTETETPSVEVRPSAYGSLENTVTNMSMTDPLLDASDKSNDNENPQA